MGFRVFEFYGFEILKRGRKRKLGESMNDVRQLEGGGFSVLKNSLVNGSINECFSSFITIIND